MLKVPTWAIINARTGSRVIFGPVMHNNKVIDNVLKIVILRSSVILFLNWLYFTNGGLNHIPNIAFFTCKELKRQRKEQLTEDDELYASSYPIR